MRRKRFNCDQCGKNFARGCNMKLLLQNVHEIEIEISPKYSIYKDIYELFINYSKY